jgi:N-dimethylarginine dimethylaminohydrolase
MSETKPTVCRRPEDLSMPPQAAPAMPRARRVLMVTPEYFNIEVAINVHMRDADGRPHRLDRALARRQWDALKAVYERIGCEVLVLDGAPGLPDMTFAANQSLPWVDQGGKLRAVLSNMADDVRHREVPYVGACLEGHGYAPAALAERTPDTLFEGMGDALWLPGRRFLLGGYGFRTRLAMYDRIAALTGASVAAFELKNPKFYHLDTCLSVLDEKTALVCPEAFTGEGRALLKAVFPRLVEVGVRDADAPGFACNAHCPDGTHVIIQAGSAATNAALAAAGYEVIEVDTSEFIKSGGSVFCLKLMLF